MDLPTMIKSYLYPHSEWLQLQWRASQRMLIRTCSSNPGPSNQIMSPYCCLPSHLGVDVLRLRFTCWHFVHVQNICSASGNTAGSSVHVLFVVPCKRINRYTANFENLRHACARTHTHTHTHACTNARIHTCTHAHGHTHTHTPQLPLNQPQYCQGCSAICCLVWSASRGGGVQEGGGRGRRKGEELYLDWSLKLEKKHTKKPHKKCLRDRRWKMWSFFSCVSRTSLYFS